MITSLDELSPAARTVALRFLDTAVADTEAELRAQVVEGLTGELCERLSADANPESVEAAVLSLGPVVDEMADDAVGFLGRLGAGVKFEDLAGRIARTWWNPADERYFVPRAFGWGWDLNVGAVAVRLGLIEPDAEAVPFTATPDAAFKAAAAVPLALGAAVGLHYIVRGRSLPARLPSHWGLDGHPDRWVSKGSAAVADLAITSLAAGAAAWAATTEGEGPQRAGVLAGATMAGGLAASTALVRGLAKPRGWAAPLGVLAASTAVAGVLYGLARAGRDAEIARDLG
ncbi:DUF1648 domain-containing protein [Propionicimonas sp.]|uniref:DUF5808 domain-containing protein n=1 Tax=Propionicimonas sp. TaxID=1955623 RepID=UPI0018026236|nr:DUF1648 domain-containing protein [Propionicimonas sp.]MBU3976891.1 DUF1648 domain-containing protein [Actinomycetota bacterium]MBA3019580.1 DUF1648 domain-containing protein [Propionicimonas sp.]MBU3986986.1 DUF1648 domain-containing protein [Actinomycetota bacterium]MBU4006898.1 DUF1648 domain-containing protein [Actinomycetota bacterium]MBU4065598.1 DUF1648 domain-containing protein [Actinomycetota bacterium]